MQYPELLNLEEVNRRIETEFTVKPTGEVQVKGNPDPELIRQLLISSDYQQDQNRRYKSEVERQARQVDFMVIGFLGCTFLLSMFCLFLTVRDQRQGVSNGEFFRGISCGQVR